jgi:hypothetical protein
MNGKLTLFFDRQSNSTILAKTLRELQFKAGGGRISKMYRDGYNNKAVHIGYVVGDRWFTAYTPFESIS